MQRVRENASESVNAPFIARAVFNIANLRWLFRRLVIDEEVAR
jgi:hypothetical protein